MMGRNASVCCWFRWTTVLGIDRVWNGIIASNRGELEERGLCTCASRDPDWIAACAHTCARTHPHTVMISSSLGRCTSAAQRGDNITFLFLWKCGNMDIVFCLSCYLICCHILWPTLKLLVKVQHNTICLNWIPIPFSKQLTSHLEYIKTTDSSFMKLTSNPMSTWLQLFICCQCTWNLILKTVCATQTFITFYTVTQ